MAPRHWIPRVLRSAIKRVCGSTSRPSGLGTAHSRRSPQLHWAATLVAYSRQHHPSTSRAPFLLRAIAPERRYIAAFLSRLDYPADCINDDPNVGGGDAHNLLVDAVYKGLLHRCDRGYYFAVLT
eukprot:6201307-Pleurochrysis_carterae.AAC.3